MLVTNESEFIDPEKCRSCGQCCKHFAIWYSKDCDSVTMSEVDRFALLDNDKITTGTSPNGNRWVRFDSPCKELKKVKGKYTCAVYGDAERPELCKKYPFEESEDCPHKQEGRE